VIQPWSDHTLLNGGRQTGADRSGVISNAHSARDENHLKNKRFLGNTY
jgi:hypothetical protein